MLSLTKEKKIRKMIKASLLAVLLQFFSPQSTTIEKLPVLKWHQAEIFNLPTQSDTTVENFVTKYINDLGKNGYVTNQQGVWIQSDWAELGNNQGKIAASAASLTKTATSLASLYTWDLNHQFPTNFYSEGEINNGILNGNLIIESTVDPLFVWEEAIAVGNTLQSLGIKEIKGDLIIVGDFMMNYKDNRLNSAQLFKQALNSREWTPIIEKQYQTVSDKLTRPEIEIKGNILLKNEIPQNVNLLLTHQSLKLVEIIRLMNVYSNNKIAENLAEKIGGGKKVEEIAVKLTKVSPTEIQLINGSGLGVDNRISPHAACKIFMAIEKLLEGKNASIADLFPISKVEDQGTIKDRNIPSGLPVKTGTLATVSALAGVIPTQERGNVWFAIVNYGNNLDKMRDKQDILLQDLAQHWQLETIKQKAENNSYFGDVNRNFVAQKLNQKQG